MRDGNRSFVFRKFSWDLSGKFGGSERSPGYSPVAQAALMQILLGIY